MFFGFPLKEPLFITYFVGYLMRLPSLFAMLIIAACAAAVPAGAQELVPETNFMVTVRAKDAKFIGSSMGGAHVTIRDRVNGDIVAEGNTSGGTGDTAKLMNTPLSRDAELVTDDSAKIEFSLELIEPMPVTVTATGPLSQPQSMATVSQDMVIIPGKDYASGNGIMLELPGFAVDILEPAAAAKEKFDAQKPVTVAANIVKMCGCAIEKDSPWPPERYEVSADIYVESHHFASAPMSFTGTPGQYAGKFLIPKAGTYKIIVSAFDPKTKEGGMDVTSLTLVP